MSSMQLSVEDLDDAKVSASLDQELRELLVTCFPKDEAIFSQHRHYRQPPAHRWIIRDGAGRLIAHACIHDKVLGTVSGDIHVGGVGEVCVHPDCRGHGLVRMLMQEIERWLARHKFEFSVLFGNANVYSSSGYVSVINPLRYFDQASGQWIVQPSPSAMVLRLGDRAWPDGQIDLRGPRF